MQSGDLKREIGFYALVSSSDDYGNANFAHATTASFIYPAAVKPKLGGEAILAGRLAGKNFVNITVRFTEETILITPDWRAKDERSGTIYNIRSNPIDPDGETQWLEILCEQGVAA